MTGNADNRQPSGDGPVATTVRESMSAIRMDFAQANQWVFYGMAIALGVGFLCAGRHPGGAAHPEKAPQEPLARR